MDITFNTPTDLELAQRGAQEAAREIARGAAERALWVRVIPDRQVTPRPTVPDLSIYGPLPPDSFYLFPHLPMEVRAKIYKFS